MTYVWVSVVFATRFAHKLRRHGWGWKGGPGPDSASYFGRLCNVTVCFASACCASLLEGLRQHLVLVVVVVVALDVVVVVVVVMVVSLALLSPSSSSLSSLNVIVSL